MEKKEYKNTQKINSLYKEIRKYNEIIKDADYASTKKKEKEELLKDLMFDLIKQKKIEWKFMSFEQWYISDYTQFWIYSSEEEIRMGIFKGLDELYENEYKHFHQFKEDYFYYGYPFYYDNLENNEKTEREKAFENGTVLSCINRKDL